MQRKYHSTSDADISMTFYQHAEAASYVSTVSQSVASMSFTHACHPCLIDKMTFDGI